MQWSLPWLFAAVLILSGCSRSTGPDDDGPGTGTAVSIGPAGGVAGQGALTLTIPPGVFSGEAALTLSEIADQPPASEAVSPRYHITGLPASASAPLHVGIACSGSLRDKSFVLAGPPSDPDGSGRTVADFAVIAARDSAGLLLCDIPASLAARAKRAGPAGEASSGELFLQAVTGMTTRLGLGPHFSVLHPSGMEPEAEALAAALEEAYSLMPELGFRYDVIDGGEGFIDRLFVTVGRSAFPELPDMDPWTFNYVHSWYALRPGGVTAEELNSRYRLSFNAAKLSADPDGTLLAGKLELLALFLRVYAFHPGPPRYSWLNASVLAWAEELFSEGGESFVPSGLRGNEDAPLRGVAPAKTLSGTERHRYTVGMAALVKYIAGRFGNSVIGDVFDIRHAGVEEFEALTKAVGPDIGTWWPQFLRAYLEGTVYSVPASVFTGMAEETFTIRSAADSARAFAGEYADLSAKFWRVDLERTDFPENAEARFTVESADFDANEIRVMVFGTGGGKLVFYGDSSDVTIQGLRELASAGYDLLAVSYNTAHAHPYLGTGNITLGIRIAAPETPPVFSTTRAWVRVGPITRNYRYEGKDCTSETESASGYLMYDDIRGSWDGTVFSATWDDSAAATGWNAAGRTTGMLRIVLDASGTRVLEFACGNRQTQYLSTGTAATEVSLAWSGAPIPLIVNDTWTVTYQTDDTVDIPRFFSLSSTYTKSWSDCVRILDAFSCGQGSVALVGFR